MALLIGSQSPSIEGATDWINGHIKSEDFLSHTTLVHFWAVSCPVCKSNVPMLQRFLDIYRAHNLLLVSIHMPRGESDMDMEKVKTTVQSVGLTGPCAIDNNHTIGDRFQTGGVWPCYFLFDTEGRLRSRAAGTLGLKMAENSLKRLLELQKEAL